MKRYIKNDYGFGLIETAIVLPLFLIIVFAVIDFGNMLTAKQRIESLTQNIAQTLQKEPNMSVADLNKYIAANIGRDDPNWTTFSITASVSPKTATDYNISSGKLIGYRDYFNPWLRDHDARNDGNIYYINIKGFLGYAWITPVPKLIGMKTDFPPDAKARFGRKAFMPFVVVTAKSSQVIPQCDVGQIMINQNGKVFCQSAPATNNNQYQPPQQQPIEQPPANQPTPEQQKQQEELNKAMEQMQQTLQESLKGIK